MGQLYTAESVSVRVGLLIVSYFTLTMVQNNPMLTLSIYFHVHYLQNKTAEIQICRLVFHQPHWISLPCGLHKHNHIPPLGGIPKTAKYEVYVKPPLFWCTDDTEKQCFYLYIVLVVMMVVEEKICDWDFHSHAINADSLAQPPHPPHSNAFKDYVWIARKNKIAYSVVSNWCDAISIVASERWLPPLALHRWRRAAQILQ